MMAYMHFLEHTLEVADEFHEIREISDRYRTLESTHVDLRRQNEQLRQDHEGMRTELQNYVKSKTNEIQSLRNKIANLKKEEEHVEQEVRWVPSTPSCHGESPGVARRRGACHRGLCRSPSAAAAMLLGRGKSSTAMCWE